jgi:hypothetical protein
MMQKKKWRIGAMAIVLATGMVALAEQPVQTAHLKQAPQQPAAEQGQVDPNVKQAGHIAPHTFGMERCETDDAFKCVCETKAKSKVVYNSNCHAFCIPYCHYNCPAGQCADSAAEPCGVIAYKKVLVKKHRTLCDVNETKCVAKPVCPPPTAEQLKAIDDMKKKELEKCVEEQVKAQIKMEDEFIGCCVSNATAASGGACPRRISAGTSPAARK